MGAGQPWRIRLFGGLRLEQGENVITRFRSQKIGALLAYLALFPQRIHTREELADLFWPDADSEAGRANLRTGLASLRRQLEPPGVPAGSVLVSRGHAEVSLNPAGIETDVTLFEKALRMAARPAQTPPEKARHLAEAVGLYRGPLLPGCYETWALTERERFGEMYVRALRDLAQNHGQTRDWPLALDFARRAVSADPLDEGAHLDVLRLLAESGQAGAARRHYREMESLFREQLGAEPPAEARALLRSSEAGAVSTNRQSIPTPPPPSSVVPSGAATETHENAPTPRPAPPISLPMTLTRFFGREEEMARIGDALGGTEGTRLLTLTGPGGAGKTRLSIEAARALAPRFTGGVWFAPLADLQTPDHLWEAVASTLQLVRAPTARPQDQASEALRRRSEVGPVLLVLDNAEQIMEGTAALVRELLAETPGVTCLVTSRQRLLLDGERELPLRPLPTPHRPGSPERLLEFPSVQMFVSRAQSARPDFQITPHNAADIAELCATLEGIPLAIELAAAWAQTLTPSQMRERLGRRFELLVSRRRDVPGRHATLRATIEWSYRLLSPELKRFFARLSIFGGGWTLEAAEDVLEEPHTQEYTAELQDRSLILRPSEETDDGAAAARFSMLEALREFGREQIAPEEQTALTRRHADYYLALAEQAREHLTGADPGPWVDRLEAEQGNFRAVLDRAPASDPAQTALRLAAALARFWEVRGHWREGSARLTQLLSQSVPSSQAARRAFHGAATLCRLLGDYEAAGDFCRLGLEAAREADDDRSAASLLSVQGVLAQYRGEYEEARRLHGDSLTLSRGINDPTACGASLHNLGRLAELQGAYQDAAKLYGEALAIFRAQGNRRHESMCLSNVGNCHYQAGNYDDARRIYEQCLAMQREVGHHVGVPISLFNLGCVSLRTGNPSEAGESYRQSLRLHWEQGNKRHVCYCFEGLAAVARRLGDSERAVCLLGAADALRGALHATLEWGEESLNPASARAQTQEPGFLGLWAVGQSMTLDQSVAYAIDSPRETRVGHTDQAPAVAPQRSPV